MHVAKMNITSRQIYVLSVISTSELLNYFKQIDKLFIMFLWEDKPQISFYLSKNGDSKFPKFPVYHWWRCLQLGEGKMVGATEVRSCHLFFF